MYSASVLISRLTNCLASVLQLLLVSNKRCDDDYDYDDDDYYYYCHGWAGCLATHFLLEKININFVRGFSFKVSRLNHPTSAARLYIYVCRSCLYYLSVHEFDIQIEICVLNGKNFLFSNCYFCINIVVRFVMDNLPMWQETLIWILYRSWERKSEIVESIYMDKL